MRLFATIFLTVMSIVYLAAPFRIKSDRVLGETIQDAESVKKPDEAATLQSAENSADKRDAADQSAAAQKAAAEEVTEEKVEKTQHQESLSNSARAKIINELKQQQNDSELEGKMSWGAEGDDLTTEMMGIIVGPPGSPYEEGVFSLKIKIPSGYPFKPPLFQFTTKIYHPNVNSNGSISNDIMKDKWLPSVGISGFLKVIWSLVADPNPYDPLEPEIAQQYLNDRDKFNEIANEWKIRYATLLVG